MASKAGPRALGTDGNDFMHRERVASHYKASASNKSRLKAVTIIQIMLIVLMMMRLSVGICVMFGVRPPTFLQKLRLPKAEKWEYAWLFSLMPCVMALLSLRRNKLFFIQQYMIGTIVFGLGPVLYGIYDNLDDLLHYWETKSAVILFKGFPMVILWNMFFTIGLQVHGFGLYFAWQLAKAWKPKEKKKTT